MILLWLYVSDKSRQLHQRKNEKTTSDLGGNNNYHLDQQQCICSICSHEQAGVRLNQKCACCTIMKDNKVVGLTTIHLPNNYTPRELALDTKRNYIYTANVYSNTLSVIDAATNNVIDTIQSSGSIVDGVTYDPVNDYMLYLHR